MMDRDKFHLEFINDHLKLRKGERRGRLERGHNEAEALFCKVVWLPLRGNFDDLHPEFEVMDWRGISYFCDFVWMPATVKLVIEIKGFGSHVRNMDRQKYCNELNRETFLTAMGFQVISFSFDDVASRPELCVNLLRMVLSRYHTDQLQADRTTLVEREIIRLACGMSSSIRPIDIVNRLQIDHRTAVQCLKQLCAKNMLMPVTGAGGKHIVRYELQPLAANML